MTAGILEIVGIFTAIVGAGAIVGAAALISTALAVLAAGAFLLLGGVVTIFIAAKLEQANKPVRNP